MNFETVNSNQKSLPNVIKQYTDGLGFLPFLLILKEQICRLRFYSIFAKYKTKYLNAKMSYPRVFSNHRCECDTVDGCSYYVEVVGFLKLIY